VRLSWLLAPIAPAVPASNRDSVHVADGAAPSRVADAISLPSHPGCRVRAALLSMLPAGHCVRAPTNPPTATCCLPTAAGSDLDMHTPHVHGTFVHWRAANRATAGFVASANLVPGARATVDFVAQERGAWLMECGVNDHWAAGVRFHACSHLPHRLAFCTTYRDSCAHSGLLISSTHHEQPFAHCFFPPASFKLEPCRGRSLTSHPKTSPTMRPCPDARTVCGRVSVAALPRGPPARLLCSQQLASSRHQGVLAMCRRGGIRLPAGLQGREKR
jgi:hypothetical protein